MSSWVFNNDNGSASNGANNCANNCANNAANNAAFRSALFSGLGSFDRNIQFCQPAGRVHQHLSDDVHLFLPVIKGGGIQPFWTRKNAALKIQCAGDVWASSCFIATERPGRPMEHRGRVENDIG